MQLEVTPLGAQDSVVRGSVEVEILRTSDISDGRGDLFGSEQGSPASAFPGVNRILTDSSGVARVRTRIQLFVESC
jgi:hypothetical protein